MRMLASLCGMTYYMGTQVTPRSLRQRHGLELISTSLACERLTYEHAPSAREVADEGDGCCLSLADAREIYAERGGGAPAPADPAAAAPPLSRALVGSLVQEQQQQGSARHGPAPVVPAPAPQPGVREGTTALVAAAAAPVTPVASGEAALATAADSGVSGSGGKSGAGGGSWNPADLVAAKLGEAAAAASAAALAPLASAASAASAAALGPLASAAGSLYAGGLGLVSGRLFPAAAAAAASALPLPDRLAGATIAGIAGMEVAASHPNSSDVKAASTSNGSACPSEWFVADDERAHVRYFVIQVRRRGLAWAWLWVWMWLRVRLGQVCTPQSWRHGQPYPSMQAANLVLPSLCD